MALDDRKDEPRLDSILQKFPMKLDDEFIEWIARRVKAGDDLEPLDNPAILKYIDREINKNGRFSPCVKILNALVERKKDGQDILQKIPKETLQLVPGFIDKISAAALIQSHLKSPIASAGDQNSFQSLFDAIPAQLKEKYKINSVENQEEMKALVGDCMRAAFAKNKLEVKEILNAGNPSGFSNGFQIETPKGIEDKEDAIRTIATKTDDILKQLGMTTKKQPNVALDGSRVLYHSVVISDLTTFFGEASRLDIKPEKRGYEPG